MSKWTIQKPYADRNVWSIWNGKENSEWRVLYQDGTQHDTWDSSIPGERGCFSSKREAEQFLEKWKMNSKQAEVKKRIENAENELVQAKYELKKLQNVPNHGIFTSSVGGGRSVFFKVTPNLVNHIKNHVGDFVIVGKNGYFSWDHSDCNFDYAKDVEKVFND